MSLAHRISVFHTPLPPSQATKSIPTRFNFPNSKTSCSSCTVNQSKPRTLSSTTQSGGGSSNYGIADSSDHDDVQELAGHDILQMFLKERRLNGDLVSKISDIIWIKDYLNVIDSEATMSGGTPQQLPEIMENEDESGLLKLTKAYEWVLGDEIAPINEKAVTKERQNDSDKRKRLNILKYDAIKREMMLLTIGVGAACSGFCLVAFSAEVAISYAVGVLISCFYLKLLSRQVDNLSRDSVPQIFMQKKSKTIGVRSEDVGNFFERVVKGSFFALSSPRLTLPAVIYGFWGLSNYFSNDLLSFQLVPAMFGLFAYKAAALVQVYRDNLDLLIVFPESWESSSD